MSPTPADPMWEALPEGPGDPRPGDARPDDPRPDDIASSRDAGLWPGDRGSLPDASRRALLALLRGPYLAAARNPALWNALLRDQDQVTARLHDLYCDLVLDVDSGVAFVRNVDAPDLQAPRAVRTAALTFLDSAMLLVLRQHLLAGEGSASSSARTRSPNNSRSTAAPWGATRVTSSAASAHRGPTWTSTVSFSAPMWRGASRSPRSCACWSAPTRWQRSELRTPG